MPVGLQIPTQQPPPESSRYTRDIFLYQDSHAPVATFAQCGTCRWWTGPKKQRCAILGKALKADAGDSCGLYVHGNANPDQPVIENVTPEEAGFVARKVRCENCRSFDHGTCLLFKMLNDLCPEKFDLEEEVDAKGCCNANKAKGSEPKGITITLQVGVG